jgi:ribosomal protein L29
MKKNERQQLKNAGVPELEKKVHDTREKLWALKRDIDLGKHKNVHEMRALRKEIARMLTQIRISTPINSDLRPKT